MYSLPFGYISICVCAYMSIYISIHGTTDWFKLGKEYNKAVYCHPAYLTCMQSTSCEMIDWMNQKLESRLPGEISTTSDMRMIPL